MGPEEQERHRKAALAAGRKSACGTKIDYRSSASADKAAGKMTAKRRAAGDGKELEAYPCPFCGGWHVGRRMGAEELDAAAR